jgi:phosphate transport system permease protein
MKADAAIKGRMLTSSIWNALLQMCALVCVLSLIGIFTLLLAKGGAVFSKVPFWDLLLGRDWIPSAYGTPKFGILGLIKSTFMVTLSAMVIAIPLGIGAAAWLSEFAPKLAREVIKPAVEMLAAIPSVAVGFFGLVVLGPVLVEVL